MIAKPATIFNAMSHPANSGFAPSTMAPARRFAATLGAKPGMKLGL